MTGKYHAYLIEPKFHLYVLSRFVIKNFRKNFFNNPDAIAFNNVVSCLSDDGSFVGALIEDFSVSQTTLDQVFINFANFQSDDTKKGDRGKTHMSIRSKLNKLVKRKNSSSSSSARHVSAAAAVATNRGQVASSFSLTSIDLLQSVTYYTQLRL